MNALRVVCVSLGLLGALSCGSAKGGRQEGTPCSVDTDCPSGQSCAPIGVGPTPAIVAPPPQCPYQACDATSACGAGWVCAPLEQAPPGTIPPSPLPVCNPTVCLPPCQETGCQPDERCRDDGICELARCDAADAAACPERFRCDPDAAMTEPRSVAGSTVPDVPDVARAIARGCVRLRCDEPNGYVCRNAWRCAPATADDASGCEPIPCTESGRCSDDTSYICEPQSSKGRGQGMDPQGCVRRNCEEGLTCTYQLGGTNIGYCDFDGPLADANGCAVRHCTEVGGLCAGTRVCDPSSALADARGCRPPNCAEPGGPNCGSSARCDPESTAANAAGCVMTAGAGGAGGAGGTGGANTNRGGSSAGGVDATAGSATTTSGSSGASNAGPMVGRCVAH